MTSVSALRPSAVQSGTIIMWQPEQGYLPVGSKVLRFCILELGRFCYGHYYQFCTQRQIEMSHLNVIKCRTCKMIWNCVHHT